jgi:hypothetical protein
MLFSVNIVSIVFFVYTDQMKERYEDKQENSHRVAQEHDFPLH